MKYLFRIVLIISTVSLSLFAVAADPLPDFTDGETLTAEALNKLVQRINALEKTYVIGDTGPAGGIVFYIALSGHHGLEAAPVDQGSAVWGCAGTAITGADRTEINAGSTNTGDILEGCATTGIASRLADNYSLNGFNDWFLPSKDQLNELYLKRNTIGADPLIYWSSSEVDDNTAWAQSFINGSQLNTPNNKFGALRVLPVRSF